MQYHVIPFTANVSSSQGADVVASQLESLISSQASDGWDYVRLEQVETHIVGNSGCFGIGATQAQTISTSMAVFQR